MCNRPADQGEHPSRHSSQRCSCSGQRIRTQRSHSDVASLLGRRRGMKRVGTLPPLLNFSRLTHRDSPAYCCVEGTVVPASVSQYTGGHGCTLSGAACIAPRKTRWLSTGCGRKSVRQSRGRCGVLLLRRAARANGVCPAPIAPIASGTSRQRGTPHRPGGPASVPAPFTTFFFFQFSGGFFRFFF